MSYLRVMFDDQEIERRDLGGPVVIGRWAGCDLAVRDILLSRRHCQISPDDRGGWRVEDLSSKNGTLLNNQRLPVAVMPLSAGDVLGLGRLKVLLCNGTLEQVGLSPLRLPAPRPLDPTESMNGTYSGFAYLEPGQTSETVAIENSPLPRPEPKRPAAYERENIYSLLNAIASSSWDSIYAEARRAAPAANSGVGQDIQPCGRRLRPRSPIDLSLQVSSTVRTAAAASVMYRHPRHRRRPVVLLWIVLIGLIATQGWFDTRRVAAARPVMDAAIPVSVNVTPVVASEPRPGWDANTVIVLQAASATLRFVL